jgi:hypothetical protein
VNPTLKLKFDLMGVNFENDKENGIVRNVFDKEMKIVTDLKMESDVTYTTSPIVNSNGPTPHVGEETTYTVN